MGKLKINSSVNNYHELPVTLTIASIAFVLYSQNNVPPRGISK